MSVVGLTGFEMLTINFIHLCSRNYNIHRLNFVRELSVRWKEEKDSRRKGLTRLRLCNELASLRGF